MRIFCVSITVIVVSVRVPMVKVVMINVDEYIILFGELGSSGTWECPRLYHHASANVLQAISRE